MKNFLPSLHSKTPCSRPPTLGMGVAHFLLQEKENEIGRAEGNKEKEKEIQALISQESWAVALPSCSPDSLSECPSENTGGTPHNPSSLTWGRNKAGGRGSLRGIVLES